jgi:hypothetical protein
LSDDLSVRRPTFKLREEVSPALNLLVSCLLEHGASSKRDRIALDTGAFLRMVAVDVHVPKGLFGRQMLLPVSSYPKGLSMNAVEAAATHLRHLIEPITAPIKIPTTQAMQ